MKIGLSIEARMNASRLPGKMALPLAGKTVLARVIERMRRVRGVTEIVVATTTNPLDDKLEEICREEKVACFRGSENDLTDRLLKLCEERGFDALVQTWGDCVLHDPGIIEKGIEVFIESGADFVHNRTPATFPRGQEVHVLKADVLRTISHATDDATYREHGTNYVFDNPDGFKISTFTSGDASLNKYTWLLDYPEDYERLRPIFESVYARTPDFSTKNLIDFIETKLKPADAPAILGGRPLNSKTFEWNSVLGEEERAAVLEVLDSKTLSDFHGSPGSRFLGGKWVREFERRWAERFNVEHAVSMNSATSCLQAAVMALGLGPGDEVIVPPLTMSASVIAVSAAGATPIFADLEPDYFCIDPASIQKKITKRTKAIVAVDLFGQPADFTGILNLAKRHNLKIIEDCAQAPGAHWNGKYAGTIGDIGVYSLNCHKAIQTGEGGVAVTRDPDLALRLQLIRNHGEAVVEGIDFPDHTSFGFNWRLTELQAAIGVPQLSKLDTVNSYKQERAEWLRAALKPFDFLQCPLIRAGCDHVYYLYVLKYKPGVVRLTRDQFVKALNAEGYNASFGYVKPIYLLPYYQKDGDKRYAKNTCPVAEKLHFEEIFYPNLIRYRFEKEDVATFACAVDRVARNDSMIACA